MLETILLHSCLRFNRFLRTFLKTDLFNSNIRKVNKRKAIHPTLEMSDTTTKAKRTISAEQLEKMQAAAKAAREKRAAEEAANPELKEKRIASQKAKRDATTASKSETPSEDDKSSETSEDKKPKKASKKANGGAGDASEKKPRVSWWATATDEQKAEAKAKAKATRDAKKASKPDAP